MKKPSIIKEYKDNFEFEEYSTGYYKYPCYRCKHCENLRENKQPCKTCVHNNSGE